MENRENGDTKITEIRNDVVRILREDFGYQNECLSPDTRFEADLGMDSLEFVELIMYVEEDHNITIPDDDAEKLRTIGELIDWIAEHRQS